VGGDGLCLSDVVRDKEMLSAADNTLEYRMEASGVTGIRMAWPLPNQKQ
jgi:hypothetical protein